MEFDECIKSLPPRSHDDFQTPEVPKVISAETLKVVKNDELINIVKELHSISQELKTLNRILKRR